MKEKIIKLEQEIKYLLKVFCVLGFSLVISFLVPFFIKEQHYIYPKIMIVGFLTMIFIVIGLKHYKDHQKRKLARTELTSKGFHHIVGSRIYGNDTENE